MHTHVPENVIIAHENRPTDMVGVRLLAASLARHDPELPLWIYLPPALITAQGPALRDLHPTVRLIEFTTDIGWACKPDLLLKTLDALPPDGRALWLDSDMITLRSVAELFDEPPQTLILSEETNPELNDRMPDRQRAMGLPVNWPREQTTLSSGVIGVTDAHRELLKSWGRFVESDAFAEQQDRRWHERLFHSDQEAFAATVCSGRFNDIPRRVLRNFNEMQQATYTAYEPPDAPPRYRVRPMIVHATGDLKPWRQSRFRFTQEVFAYFDVARQYMHVIPPSLRPRFRPRSGPARLWRMLGGDCDRMIRLRQAVPGLRPWFVRTLRRLGIDPDAS